MQLDGRLSLRMALAAASCGLLGITSQAAVAEGEAEPVQVDTALLYYAERNRVNVIEPVLFSKVQQGENESVSVTAVADAITGASPNGATMADKPQTFGNYTAPAHQLPLAKFSDHRYAVSAEWEQPLDRLTRTVIGANGSTEKDYNSIGLSASLARDFNDKLTTLSLGVSANWDSVIPVNAVFPDGLALVTAPSSTAASSTVRTRDDSMITASTPHALTSASGISGGSGLSTSRPSRSKKIGEGIIGITQVVTRRTLMQFNYSLGSASGYLTDPYKIISMVNAVSGETTSYRTEQRPGTRLHQSLYWKTVYHLPKDVVHLSYRYYWDDWGIKSNTIDLNYHCTLWRNHYLEPQVRFYAQNAADFYRHSLVDGAQLPQFASADYRLAEMRSYTVGLKYGVPVGDSSELSARVNYMRQRGNSHPADAIGVEQGQDLYPGLDASYVQVSYNFKF